MATGIDKYINDILTKIYANQNLCKLLYYDVDDPLSQSDIVDTTVLRTDKENQRIFVTPFSIDTEDEVKSKLHVMINNFSLDSKTKYYLDFDIDFIISINTQIWELTGENGEVKTRLSLIVHELLQTFNHKHTEGTMGDNHFENGKIQKFNDGFWGMIITLTNTTLPTYVIS